MNQFKYESIADNLVFEIPEFKEILIKHKNENGTVLPHVLFGDLTRFVIENYRKSKNDNKSKRVFEKSLDFIENLLNSGDGKLEELAQVSFLENLSQAEEDYEEIKKHLRKNSLQKLLRIGSR